MATPTRDEVVLATMFQSWIYDDGKMSKKGFRALKARGFITAEPDNVRATDAGVTWMERTLGEEHPAMDGPWHEWKPWA